jgi:hypothetical protein
MGVGRFVVMILLVLVALPSAASASGSAPVTREVTTVNGAELLAQALGGLESIDVGGHGITVVLESEEGTRAIVIGASGLAREGRREPLFGLAILGTAAIGVLRVAARVSRLFRR